MDLALVDIDPEALKVAEGLAAKMIAARKAKIKLSASTRRRDVLREATAVICTIGVGGRRAWEQDVFVPRKYGIYQPVGDTVGPGGTSRAMRMIPSMVAVAKDVMNLCPRALFFNYGNPMSATCRAIRKATAAPVVGLCHGIPDTARLLAGKLGAMEADGTTPRFKYSAVGINHCSWFTDVRVDDKPALDRLLEMGREALRNSGEYDTGGPKAGQKDPEERRRFSWQLTLFFGLFPGVGDRHMTEFFPALTLGLKGYFGKTLGIDAYSFEGTIESGDRKFDEMKAHALSDKPLPADYFAEMEGEHEQVVEIIDAIRGNSGAVYPANVPNHGQVPGLLDDAVIECPVRATSEGLKPVQQGRLPSGVENTLNARFAAVETTVEAALEGNGRKFAQALLLDGAVYSLETATKLAAELMEAQSAFLSGAEKSHSRSGISMGERVDDGTAAGPDEGVY